MKDELFLDTNTVIDILENVSPFMNLQLKLQHLQIKGTFKL